jgi:formylmethanofuran dehydrogenase subunit E
MTIYDESCEICKSGKSVLIVSVLHGDITKDGIKCNKCGDKWFDHYMLIDGLPHCIDCAEIVIEGLGYKGDLK